MSSVPIPSLSPSVPLPTSSCIDAIVSLVWPYSSSTQHCALLLADPDARLRYRKGQVRVRFNGPSAQAIARSHVSIGDKVQLSLEGGQWLTDDAGALARTPGKSVDGE